MIHSVNEPAVQQADRADQNNAVMVEQEVEKTRAARPVEKADDASKSEMGMKQDDTKSKYIPTGGTIVFEKYNKKGDVILRIPPEVASEA